MNKTTGLISLLLVVISEILGFRLLLQNHQTIPGLWLVIVPPVAFLFVLVRSGSALRPARDRLIRMEQEILGSADLAGKGSKSLYSVEKLVADIGQLQDSMKNRLDSLYDESLSLTLDLSELYDMACAIERGNVSRSAREDSANEIVANLGKSMNKIIANMHAENDAQASETMDLALGISEIFDALNQITKGDLRVRVSADLHHEILDKLAQMVNKMTDQLKTALTQIMRITSQLNNSIGMGIKKADQSCGIIDFNQTSVGQGFNAVREQIGDFAKKMERVTEFVETIDDISNRSNLLAWNASIESVHAGSAGAGFAVVAHEMQDLSAQTSKSSAEISTVIEDIEKDMAGILESITTRSGKISEESRLILACTNEMKQIMTDFYKLSEESDSIIRKFEL